MLRIIFLFSFLFLTFVLSISMSRPLYAEISVIKDGASFSKQNNFMAGLAITQQSRNQNYKRFHILGYQKKQSGTITSFYLGHERKQVGKIFFHTDASFGNGGSHVTLSDRSGQRIGDGEMQIQNFESNILTGYTFLVDRYTVTPYLGFNYFYQNDKSSTTVLNYDKSMHPGETYFKTDNLMALIGIRLESELSSNLLGGLNFNVKRSLRSKTLGFIGADSEQADALTVNGQVRIIPVQKVTSLQVEFPFMYRYTEGHFFTIAPSYQYVYTNETFLTSKLIEHDTGLRIGYNYRF